MEPIKFLENKSGNSPLETVLRTWLTK